MDDEVFQGLVEAVGGTRDKEPASSTVAWILLLVVGLVAAGVVVMAVLNRRKLATAKHKADVAANDLRQQKELYDKLEEGATERATIQEHIEDLELQKTEIDLKVEKLEVDRAEFERKLAAVTSWDDVA